MAAWLAIACLAMSMAGVPWRFLPGEPPQVEASPSLLSRGASGENREQTASPSKTHKVQSIRIVNVTPHDPKAFTQGLVFSKGFLYESTGLRGQSTLRRVDLKTGKVLQSHSLAPHHFAEGLTLWKDRLIQLTWQSEIGFVYDSRTFAKEGEFSYEGEGWGITHNGHSLIMSDGTPVLRFLDPTTFELTRSLEVKDDGIPVPGLNELEFVKGEILANIWGKDWIARIDPDSGQVLGWIDASPLRNALGPVQGIDALNGIAHDPDTDRLFITGKLWPSLFEIQVLP